MKFHIPIPALLLLILPLSIVLLNGCAATRKLDAYTILSKANFEFVALTLDSVAINPDLFPKTDVFKSGLLPNPQVVTIVQNLARNIIEKPLGTAHVSVELNIKSSSEDSLWIRGLTAHIQLDSLYNLPLVNKDSSVLATGNNRMVLVSQVPIDRRIFSLTDVKKVFVEGTLNVALDSEGPTVPLNFKNEKMITPEEMKSLESRARESLLNGLVNDWVGAILPEEEQ
ncbi:MAG: hypothetical protein HUK21_11420 [Fibrobacteraceae bacterium]|nr:hypothetical protein [Fibrobacteraceae bacterium]